MPSNPEFRSSAARNTVRSVLKRVRALGPALLVVLWAGAIVLSLLVMAAGGVRRAARVAGVRTAAPQSFASARLWRVAALASLVIVLHVALLAYGATSDLAKLGSLSWLSGTAWLLGLLYGAIGVWLMLLMYRSRGSAQSQGRDSAR